MMKRAIVVFLIAALMILITVGLLGCGGGSPEATFKQFVKEVEFNSMSPSVAKEMLSSDAQLYTMERANELLKDGVTITEVFVHTDTNVAKVKYKSEAMGGEVYTGTLVKEEGKWKIFGVLEIGEM